MSASQRAELKEELMPKGKLVQYRDSQPEAVSYFPDNFEEAEKGLILEQWKKKTPCEDLWFVFATCTLPDQTLRFVYPISAPPFTPVADVVRHAQIQHEHFRRPPLVDGRVQTLRVQDREAPTLGLVFLPFTYPHLPDWLAVSGTARSH
jgi:hypothetical protein